MEPLINDLCVFALSGLGNCEISQIMEKYGVDVHESFKIMVVMCHKPLGILYVADAIINSQALSPQAPGRCGPRSLGRVDLCP